MSKSKIEWTDATWNPVTGCTPKSEGCANCFAERMARRLHGRHGYPPIPDHFKVTVHPERLREPLRWRKPRMVFVCSMGDLFHDDVPVDDIMAVWEIMRIAKRHTFQILTKRPERMYWFFRNTETIRGLVLPNVWLGVTAENQARADERIPFLLQTPAAVRFLSCEPLLGAINLGLAGTCPSDWGKRYSAVGDHIHWVIAGGETGYGARPMNPQWARSLRDQCQEMDVPFFFKSWGAWLPYNQVGTSEDRQWTAWVQLGVARNKRIHEWPDGCLSGNVGKKAAGCLLDGRTWDEFPERDIQSRKVKVLI